MNKKGFTLIELLVVIAIIGVLASVVLASLNTARSKGADAAIKANLANLRAQAAIYYDNNSSAYAPTGTNVTCTVSNTGTVAGTGCPVGLLSDNTFQSGVKSAASAAGATANVNFTPTAWAVFTPLKTTGAGNWCVDSTGFSATTTTAVTTTNC